MEAGRFLRLSLLNELYQGFNIMNRAGLADQRLLLLL